MKEWKQRPSRDPDPPDDDFAKLYTVDGYGQILLTVEEDGDEVWGVKTTWRPKGYGLCSIWAKFNGEDGYDRALRHFNLLNCEDICKVLDKVSEDLLGS